MRSWYRCSAGVDGLRRVAVGAAYALQLFTAVAAGATDPVSTAAPSSKASSASGIESSHIRLDTTASEPADSDVRHPSRDVELRAGLVEIEGPFNRLSLSQGVELTVYRYRVTAERLTLDRTPQGIQVEGDGRVAFCPCVAPPLTIGFSRGTVAPPTDLLLKSATFRTCGVPVLWLPAFWIRSPNKIGLHTPVLAWRGSDGPWIGSGLHVPLSRKADTNEDAIEVLLGAYGRGGVDLGIQVHTPQTVSRLRWDHFHRSLVEVDAVGTRNLADRAALAWQVDSIRGERARVGPVSFEPATRKYDRLRVETTLADGESLYSVGMRWDTARAGPFRETGLWGPSLRWGVGTAIGDRGRVDSSLLALSQFRANHGAQLLVLHSSDIGLDWRPGPLSIRWMSHERWLVGSGSRSAYDGGLIGTDMSVGLPLVRKFGRGRSGLEHWMEPFALATAAWRDAANESRHTSPGSVVTAQLGLTNKLGVPADSVAATLQLRVGSVMEPDRHARAVAARWLASGPWTALGGDVGWGGDSRWLALIRSRLGRIDRIAIRSVLEGRGRVEQTQIRWLLEEGWTPWQIGWFDKAGWLSRNDIDVAVGRQFVVSAGIAYDLRYQSMVSEQVSAAYRHPCGCLAVGSRINWRAGRSGWDAMLGLDLMP